MHKFLCSQMLFFSSKILFDLFSAIKDLSFNISKSIFGELLFLGSYKGIKLKIFSHHQPITLLRRNTFKLYLMINKILYIEIVYQNV